MNCSNFPRNSYNFFCKWYEFHCILYYYYLCCVCSTSVRCVEFYHLATIARLSNCKAYLNVFFEFIIGSTLRSNLVMQQLCSLSKIWEKKTQASIDVVESMPPTKNCMLKLKYRPLVSFYSSLGSGTIQQVAKISAKLIARVTWCYRFEFMGIWTWTGK